MVEIGKVNQLRIVKEQEFGLFLDGAELGAILLPRRLQPAQWRIGDVFPFFVCYDASGRLMASAQLPKAAVGEVAVLTVKAITPAGAILDWGIPCELLAPLRDQKDLMRKGHSYPVYVYHDREQKRIVASSDLNNFLDRQPHAFQEGEAVELLLVDQTDLGYKAIINNAHWGVLYQNEVFQPLQVGQRLPGFIKKVRSDQKIDLTCHKPGLAKADELADRLLLLLAEKGGFLPLTDSSPPEAIYQAVGESKKTYKKAVGILYKKRLIALAPDGIRLAGE